MISDLAVCDYLNALYGWNGEQGQWDEGDLGNGDHGLCWTAKLLDGVWYVFFRGSKSFLDWLRDFYALALPFHNEGLGPVHPGFYIGMPELTQGIVKLSAGKPIVFSGHSLGAGRACIATGLAALSGATVARRVCFGEPKPGYAELGQLILPIPAASYENGEGRSIDEVTRVPISFPPEEYVHPTPLIEVCARPGSAGPQPSWGPLDWHHLPLYRQALVNAGMTL